MTAKPRATAAAAPAGAAPSYGQLTRTMRPSNPHAPDYGTLPVYEQGLAEVRAAGVDEFVADTFDPAPEGRARTRALLRSLV